jgi:hypothetical protein
VAIGQVEKAETFHDSAPDPFGQLIGMIAVRPGKQHGD